MENEFKVGDRVDVVDIGGGFSTYNEFFESNNLMPFRSKFEYGETIKRGIYKIVGIGCHPEYNHYGTLYLLENAEGQVFIIGNRDGRFMRLVEPATLTTKEMINAIQPGQIYRSDEYGTEITYEENGYLNAHKMSGLLHGNLSMKAKWTLVPAPPKPVPFMEAVKEFSEGNTVICSHNHHSHKYAPAGIPFCSAFCDEMNTAPDADEILNGIWTIEP
jgi:hypothetical protein